MRGKKEKKNEKEKRQNPQTPPKSPERPGVPRAGVSPAGRSGQCHRRPRHFDTAERARHRGARDAPGSRPLALSRAAAAAGARGAAGEPHRSAPAPLPPGPRRSGPGAGRALRRGPVGGERAEAQARRDAAAGGGGSIPCPRGAAGGLPGADRAAAALPARLASQRRSPGGKARPAAAAPLMHPAAAPATPRCLRAAAAPLPRAPGERGETGKSEKSEG